MTIEEAIKILSNMSVADDLQGDETITTALLMARDALNKKTPKKPNNCYSENVVTDNEVANFGECSNCGIEVQEGMEYCMTCGQAIDWRVIDEQIHRR